VATKSGICEEHGGGIHGIDTITRFDPAEYKTKLAAVSKALIP
jgi:hypothetical protein